MLTLAVNGNATLCHFRYLQKSLQDIVTRCAAIDKEEIMVFEPRIYETPCVIDLLVEPHNVCDVVFPKIRKVGLGGMERIPCKKKCF